MLNSIKSLFSSDKSDFAQLVKEGALIVDVRTTAEYAAGHIEGSINIPLNQLNTRLDSLKDKKSPIITCCASGNRSASALNILKSKGYVNVYNGGGWQNLNQKIK